MKKLMNNMLAIAALVFATAVPHAQAEELSLQEQMIHRRDRGEYPLECHECRPVAFPTRQPR